MVGVGGWGVQASVLLPLPCSGLPSPITEVHVSAATLGAGAPPGTGLLIYLSKMKAPEGSCFTGGRAHAEFPPPRGLCSRRATKPGPSSCPHFLHPPGKLALGPLCSCCLQGAGWLGEGPQGRLHKPVLLRLEGGTGRRKPFTHGV